MSGQGLIRVNISARISARYTMGGNSGQDNHGDRRGDFPRLSSKHTSETDSPLACFMSRSS